MNKKIIVVFLFTFCVIATIAISVWGKIPDGGNRNAVESIEIIDKSTDSDKCNLNEDGEKIILLKRGTTTYKIEYVITPSDATELNVYFVIINGDNNATIDDEGNVTFKNEAGITVKVYSNLTDGKSDTVTIDFTGEVTSDDDTEDLF